MKHVNSIFCIEGLWDNDLRNKTSVQPILDLLERIEHIPYIHKDCATREEFEFYLKKWVQQKYKHYTILYLAFHGDHNKIYLGADEYSLDEMAKMLADKCYNAIIIIASCSTLAIDKRHLKRFLLQTGAVAICGYKVDVDWMKSTAFELLLLSILQENEFSGRGIASIEKKTVQMAKMFDKLEFRIVTVKDL